MKKIVIAGSLMCLLLMAAGRLPVQAGERAGIVAGSPVASRTEQVKKSTVKAWLKKGAWRNGFKGQADKHVNLDTFYVQYHKNKEQWDAAFKWLGMTDLLNAKAGKYQIPGTTMTASVQDGRNLPLKGHWTESHRRKIDFMYVVKGVEGFGLLDHATSRPQGPYDEKKDVIHYDFDASKVTRFSVGAGHFIICFPSDWHLPLLETNLEDQNFRVIVIKVDYKE